MKDSKIFQEYLLKNVSIKNKNIIYLNQGIKTPANNNPRKINEHPVEYLSKYFQRALYKNHNLSKTLSTYILSAFINNDNQKIIKILKKLIIIYEKILRRKKLIYFLKYYYNAINLIYDNNSNYLNTTNKSIIIPTNCYAIDSNKQYINSYTQVYPDKYSTFSFGQENNYFSYNGSHHQYSKSKNNYSSLQKKSLNDSKIVNKISKNSYNPNFIKKYNTLNSAKIKSIPKIRNETSQQNLISNFTKRHQITKIITNSSNNSHFIDNHSNKRTLSYGNLGKTFKKMEYKFRPMHYGNYSNTNRKYMLNKSSFPSTSQSIREFFPKPRFTNCDIYENYQIIPDSNLFGSNYESINNLYCSNEQLKINQIPNNFRKLKTKNLINNINVLLNNEVPIINNNDIYSNNNNQYNSAVSSPTNLNKAYDLYYNKTVNDLCNNNEENQINAKILAYINDNNELKQELIDRMNNNTKSKSNKTLFINQNTQPNESNNNLYVNDSKNLNCDKILINTDNNKNDIVKSLNNNRIKTDYKSYNNFQIENNKKQNKENNSHVVHRNKDSLDKQNIKKVEKAFSSFTGNNENIPIGSVNILPKSKKTTIKCNKTKYRIKNFNNNLNENNCLNLTINADKINNTNNSLNKKQINIISNEINEEFNLRNEGKLLKNNELNDTLEMTVQSMNDSKMLEMASKYLYEDNAKVDKDMINEILNEKNAQKLLKKYK